MNWTWPQLFSVLLGMTGVTIAALLPVTMPVLMPMGTFMIGLAVPLTKRAP